MSSLKEQSIKVCCSTGTPHAVGGCGEYSPCGRIIQLPDNGPSAYFTAPPGGAPTNKSALVVMYDIFGLDIIPTRRFVDILAAKTNMRVVMPDVFRGKPWPMEKFPPSSWTDFRDWTETAGGWDVVSKDIVSSHKFLLSEGLEKSAPLGILGFCWGGLRAMHACSGETRAQSLGDCRIAAGVVLHGSFLSPEDAEHITVPVFFMPAGSDPDLGPIKAVLDRKPFGAQCGLRRFDGEVHGFASARGDWTVDHTREAIIEAIQLSSDFFLRHLPK